MAASTDNNPAYAEALDDVHTRFILNLPSYELRSAPRIFFQLEQAWWFYDDFLCDGAQSRGESALPRFKHVKPFSLAMFHFSPLLEPMLPQFERMYDEYSTYKRSISTYGTILLNADATKVVLCRVYKGKSWTLPGGKVNQHERGKDAAARETYEETGFDPESERGVCAVWKARRERGEGVEELRGAPSEGGEDTGALLPWRPLQDTDKLVYTEKDTDKRRTCYVCRGVPETFPFEPVARKEVSEVGWHGIDALPKHTYAVLPFVHQLKRWIKRDNRKRGIESGRGTSRAGSRGKRAEARSGGSAATPRGGSRGKQRRAEEDECGLTPFFSDEGNAPWEDTGATELNEPPADVGGTPSRKEKKRDTSTGKKGRAGSKGRLPSRSGSRAGSRGRQVAATDPLVESALAAPGESDRWTADQMFATNEAILGKKFTYDGNPHDFAERGFDVVGEGRVDPHAFRVVGGGFMNSGEVDISAPPEAAALQPLMNARRRSLSGEGKSDCATAGEDLMELTPFFSNDGKAPWEEGAVGGIQKAREPAGQSNSKGLALLSQLRQGASANEGGGIGPGANIAEKAEKKPKKVRSRKNGQGKTAAEAKGDKGGAVDASVDEFFMTDREITAKSQAEKLSILPPPSAVPSSRQIAQAPPPPPEDEHLAWMKQWARQLPQAGPTKEFGDFRLDVGTVMSAMAAATKT